MTDYETLVRLEELKAKLSNLEFKQNERYLQIAETLGLINEQLSNLQKTDTAMLLYLDKIAEITKQLI